MTRPHDTRQHFVNPPLEVRFFPPITRRNEPGWGAVGLGDDPYPRRRRGRDGRSCYPGCLHYPLDYGDGAISIQLPSKYAPFLGGYHGNWDVKRAVDFGWTHDQYRRILLVIRAVSTLLRYHGIELTSRFANKTSTTSSRNLITLNTPTGESLFDVIPYSLPFSPGGKIHQGHSVHVRRTTSTLLYVDSMIRA